METKKAYLVIIFGLSSILIYRELANNDRIKKLENIILVQEKKILEYKDIFNKNSNNTSYSNNYNNKNSNINIGKSTININTETINYNLLLVENIIYIITDQIEEIKINIDEKFYLKVNCFISSNGKFYFNIASENKNNSNNKELIINKLIELKKFDFKKDMERINKSYNDENKYKELRFDIEILNK